MTIKELETMVGMTRANVRFYEQEGLLTPARLPNGYRDYSQEDAVTLRKIKLFRQLHLDLDTIRNIQAGTLELSEALAEQLNSLEADQTALNLARQVCQELYQSGADYQHFDPVPWLNELERPSAKPTVFVPPEDTAPAESSLHPWQRYLARYIDQLIINILLAAVAVLVLHVPILKWQGTLPGYLINFLSGWVHCVIQLFAETVMLVHWGTTPGKLIFGISIRSSNGEKLSWEQACARSRILFASGLGFGLPLYREWRIWHCYMDCLGGKHCEWEKDEDFQITPKEKWNNWFYPYKAAFASTVFLCYCASLLLGMRTLLPPNRGALTAKEFEQNYYYYLESDRRYRPDQEDMNMLDQVNVDCEPVLEDEQVVGVILHFWADTNTSLWLDRQLYERAALLALAGSLPQNHIFHFQTYEWSNLLDRSNLNYEISHDGISISQSAALENFEDDPFIGSEFALLTAEKGKTAHFTQTFEARLEE